MSVSGLTNIIILFIQYIWYLSCYFFTYIKSFILCKTLKSSKNLRGDHNIESLEPFINHKKKSALVSELDSSNQVRIFVLDDENAPFLINKYDLWTTIMHRTQSLTNPLHYYSNFSLNIIPEECTIGNDYFETCYEGDELDEKKNSKLTSQKLVENKERCNSTYFTKFKNSFSQSNLALHQNYLEEEKNIPIESLPSITSNKLANFFTKPFRNNPLKRTKSVSKLESEHKLGDRIYW
uniref:Uncharacterized protein n=1 Tax=Strongyloides stercoralis TaxID=6248 RepID=A0AAF5HYJ3_STRER